MNGKKPLLLLPVGLAFLICTVALVISVGPTAFGQQQGNTGGNQNMTGATTTTTTNNTSAPAAGTIDCQMAASSLGGLVIPNPTGVCDVAVPRQGLQVQDTATGATLNNLLVINPLFEFTPVSNQGTTGTTNQTMVYGFAEFALMETELPSATRMLSNSSWNVVAVHNHVIGESPSMIFVHAVANGDINTLVRDARTVLDTLTTQMQPQSGNQTATTGGGTTGGNMNNSSPSAGSLTGGTTTGEGATAGDGVGTFGGGGGTPPGPGVGTTEGGGGGSGATTGGQQQQQQGGGGGGTTTGGNGGGGGGEGGTTGGAAGPQVRP